MIGKDGLELQEFIDCLVGTAWKGLAHAQYMLSAQEGKSHEEAMKNVTDAIMEMANHTIKEAIESKNEKITRQGRNNDL